MYSIGVTGKEEKEQAYLIANSETHLIIASCPINNNEEMDDVGKRELINLVTYANIGLKDAKAKLKEPPHDPN